MPQIQEIQEKALKLRESVIEMLLEAGSGHSAGPLGMADIFATLYFEILNIDPKNPRDPNRDRLILSNGHICPILYATLAHRGFFPKEELKTLRKLNSRLQGHPHFSLTSKDILPGVENTSGPLGQGISQAIGAALAAKLNNQSYRTYVIGSDAELQEGQTLEAAMWAGAHRPALNNLTWIIDRNNIQIDGHTEDILPLEPLRGKLESFNWHVLEIDGHNIEEITSALKMVKSIVERPTAIIARTIPGKGVDFMEYKFEWHGKPPKKDEAKLALDQLRTLAGRIRSEHQ